MVSLVSPIDLQGGQRESFDDFQHAQDADAEEEAEGATEIGDEERLVVAPFLFQDLRKRC